MRDNFRKIIFTLVILSFLWFLAPKIILAVDSTLPVRPLSQGVTYEEFSNLRGDIERLRDENYQTMLETSQKTIDKIDQYTDRLTFLATLMGIFLTALGVFFGINFYFAKKDFTRQLDEIKAYVATAKKNANSVKKLAEEADKQNTIIFQGVKDFQKNKKEMSELLAKAKMTKTLKVKEIDDALTRIQEKESELSQRMLQAVNNIQSMNSQASAISGSANFSSPYGLGTAKKIGSYPGTLLDEYTTEPELFTSGQCSRCGKLISPLEDLGIVDNSQFVANLGEKLCPECKIKETSKSPK